MDWKRLHKSYEILSYEETILVNTHTEIITNVYSEGVTNVCVDCLR